MAQNEEIVVAISGGFDPIHMGHIRLIKEASKLGTKLIVILNTDEFLLHKKGYVFMPLEERKGVLESIKGVSEVVVSLDKDLTVAESLRYYRPNIFANGGDRIEAVPEENIACGEIGCKQVFGVGGSKMRSSSKLVERLR